ncbi:MAG: alkaline shock response membrane anchor protein AmaP [Bacillota bacterium]
MNLVHRFLLLLSSILLFITGLVLLAVLVGQVVYHMKLASMAGLISIKYFRYWIFGLAVLYIFPGYKLLRYSFRRVLEEKRLKYDTKLGEVIVAQEAVETLVNRACRKVRGVRDVEVEVKARKEGILIKIELSVMADMNIPQIQSDIRGRVQDYLQETMSRKAEDIKVSVTKIVSDNRNKLEWGV